MIQEATLLKQTGVRSQHIAPLLTLALCVGGAILLGWSAGLLSTPCESGNVWSLPRSLAASSGSASIWDLSLNKAAQPGWEAHALVNLTNYRNGLLSLVRPYYGKQDFWSIFLPVISCPPNRPLTRYGGTGDGSKLLCSLSVALQKKGCVIYSLGSNGNYDFERAMLKDTLCEVHTFDCTYKAGTSQSPGRHFYHHWCLGQPSQGEQYRTWSNITTSLGHKKVHLLKMDIEGYEHDVIPAWTPKDDLPDELSMEIHANPGGTRPGTAAELGLTFLHLANLGYAAYSREINPWGPECCAELSFMKLGHSMR